jgi:hypothetical protein
MSQDLHLGTCPHAPCIDNKTNVTVVTVLSILDFCEERRQTALSFRGLVDQGQTKAVLDGEHSTVIPTIIVIIVPKLNPKITNLL